MTTQSAPAIDLKKTAVVIMDFQNDILKNAADPVAVAKNAATVLAGARKAGIPVYHVQHRGGAFEADTPGAAIIDEAKPLPTEKVFVKTKTGSFSTTPLDVTLRENGIDTMVLMGVTTSGCVLSTVRWAGDIGYKFIVVKDACGDRDEEVHRVLTEKIFGRQGMVLNTKDFLGLLAKR